MPVSPNFKTAINNYLQGRAAADELFAVTYAKENKNLDECCTYILNQVKLLGQEGFADEEIYKMAVHYYDEDNIEVGKPFDGRVIVNHHIDKPAPPKPVELSEEENIQVRQLAIDKAVAIEQERLKKIGKPGKKSPAPTESQPSLF